MTIQEELSGCGKKLNTNGDKDDQSGRSTESNVRGSINPGDSMSSAQGPIVIKELQETSIKSLDLGSTDSSWMDAMGTLTDSEGEEEIKEVE